MLEDFGFKYHPQQLCIALNCGDPNSDAFFHTHPGKFTLFRSLE